MEVGIVTFGFSCVLSLQFKQFTSYILCAYCCDFNVQTMQSTQFTRWTHQQLANIMHDCHQLKLSCITYSYHESFKGKLHRGCSKCWQLFHKLISPGK